MKYRSEIDGLRAIAIIPVVLFHLGVPFLSGGYLGVDVFFVISGYLITSILISDVVEGKFSIKVFYERRARRILPALTVVIITTSIIFPYISDNPQTMEEYGGSIISVVLFISNLFFWSNSGYFGNVSETTPLLHTWSLSVEEQFYIFFPLLLVFLHSKKKISTTLVIWGLILISLLIAEWGWRNSSQGNFYLLPSRLWELLLGSIVALTINKPCFSNLNIKIKSFIAFISFITLILSFFIFTPETPHPSSITLFPVLSVVFILIFATGTCIVGRLLTLKPVIFVGTISYSLYLWHQPLLAFFRMKSGHDIDATMATFLFLSLIVLSYFSWRFVEQPFRSRVNFTTRKLSILSICALILMLTTGGIFLQNTKILEHIDPVGFTRYQIINTASSKESNSVINDNCKIWSDSFNDSFIKQFDTCSLKHGKAIFVIGGSHGIDLYNAVALSSDLPFIVSVSKGFCRAHKPVSGERRKVQCQYDDFLEFLKVHSNKISVLLYTQTPDRLFMKNIFSANTSDLSTIAIDDVITYFSKVRNLYHLNVTFVGMLPPILYGPKLLDHAQELAPQLNNAISANAMKLTLYVDEVFQEKATDSGFSYISKIDSFDLRFPDDLVINNQLSYSDNRHISRAGEIEFGRRFIKHLHKINLF